MEANNFTKHDCLIPLEKFLLFNNIPQNFLTLIQFSNRAIRSNFPECIHFYEVKILWGCSFLHFRFTEYFNISKINRMITGKLNSSLNGKTHYYNNSLL